MEHFVDIFSGVAKIVVAVVGSAVASTQIPKPRETLKDFGFIITNVLLPCLFLSQMVEAASFDMLKRSYILFLAAGFAVFIGFCGARVLTRFVFPDSLRFSTIDGVTMKLVLDKSAAASAKAKRVKGAQNRDRAVVPPQRLVIRIPADTTADEVMHSLVIPSKEDLQAVGYRTCVTIATMLQNTFVLPMSLLQSLVSKQNKSNGSVGAFDWVDLQTVTGYIFFFNIVITIAFWVVGPVVVRGGARLTAERHRICEIIARHNACKDKVSHGTQTGPEEGSGALTTTGGSNEAVPYSWRDGNGDNIMVIRDGDTSINEDAEAAPTTPTFDMDKIKANVAPLINAPLCSMFLGIVLGMIPFVKAFLVDGYGRVVFDVCKLIGDGTVPASLFLLGCNLSTDFSVVASKATTFKHFSHGALLPNSDDEEDEESEYEDEATLTSVSTVAGAALLNGAKFKDNSSFTNPAEFNCSFIKGEDPALEAAAAGILARLNKDEEVKKKVAKKPKEASPSASPAFNTLPSPSKLYGFDGISPKFLFVLMLARLVILPAILFAITYFIIQTQMVASIAEPCGNLVLLTLLVELFAPTAINSALLFNMEQFMIREYSKALLYEYTFAVITLMGWLMLTVQLVQGPECAAQGIAPSNVASALYDSFNYL